MRENLAQIKAEKSPHKKKRCKVCHKWFQPISSIQVYCSFKCYQIGAHRVGQPLPKKQRCKYCGNWYQPKRRNTRYCSERCQQNAYWPVKMYEMKVKAVEYKGGKCSKCGYNGCLAALEFHHRNPLHKKKYIRRQNKTMIVSTTWKTLQKELDKCDLLCANCHREIHHNDSSR
jgi:predicted nucleic acid-binding Zn ribbon protein